MASLMVEAVQIMAPALALAYRAPDERSRNT